MRLLILRIGVWWILIISVGFVECWREFQSPSSNDSNSSSPPQTGTSGSPRSQSCIVSGESGAGKTVACTLVFEFSSLVFECVTVA